MKNLARMLVLVIGTWSVIAVPARAAQLSDTEVENLVRRSYQYVAMYNVNNKFAMKQGGWNICDADTKLKDHTMREIARPNNDTLYIGCMLDLRKEPVVLEMPAFSSKYVSLMVTGYDHYVNVPMATRLGDFGKPEKILFYTARTENYDGGPVKGVDRVFEATGDFISAVLRIMPHSNDPERFERIVRQMGEVRLQTLSELQGGKPRPVDPADFPAVGKTDPEVFGNNYREVMQFVVNHTTFSSTDPLDQALLAALEPLGIVPGRPVDPRKVMDVDPERLRNEAEKVQRTEFARSQDPAVSREYGPGMFQPKGKIPLEVQVLQSVVGPIGLPAAEAMYFPVATTDGSPMNAQHDYVVTMTRDELPPAKAFWSLTLYDSKNGFFIPNDRRKYSVGENAGMVLDDDGGVRIHVAAAQPEGVPPENWLPINRGDEDLDIVLRVYVPEMDRIKSWSPPKAERLEQ